MTALAICRKKQQPKVKGTVLQCKTEHCRSISVDITVFGSTRISLSQRGADELNTGQGSEGFLADQSQASTLMASSPVAMHI